MLYINHKLKNVMFRFILFLLLFSLSQISMALTYTIKLSEAELQKKVDAMMPIEKKKLFFKLKLSEPKIELIEGSNEIGIFTHIDFDSKFGIKGAGRAKITGALSYDADSNEFFFKNSKIQQLEIDKVSQKNIQQIKGLVQKVVSKILAKHPVYRLKDDNLKHKLTKSVLQSVSVKDKQLLLELSML